MQFELLHYNVIWSNNSLFIFRFGSVAEYTIHTFAVYPIYQYHVVQPSCGLISFYVGGTMWRYEATNGHITEITIFFSFVIWFFLHQANCIDPMGGEFISLMNFNSLSLQRLYCFLHTIWPSFLLFYMH